MVETGVRVTALNVFPVKSCRGLSVQEVEVDSFGIVGDRRFMLVDGANRFTSQRKLPRLALVEVYYIEGEGGKKLLRFSAPGMTNHIHQPLLDGPREVVSIWDDTVMAVDQGREVARWYNEFMGLGSSHLRLMASAESSGDDYRRSVSQIPVKLREKLSHVQVALSDEAPISVLSEESLSDLNWRLRERGGEEVPMKQFRMNIEVSGCSEPFEEDKWLLVQIGAVPLLAYQSAVVCKIIIAVIVIYSNNSCK